MCGIAGILKRRGMRAENALIEDIRAMADRLVHRGPDGDGYWSDGGAGIAFAHRRLAIVDLSETGAQPMLSADGRYVLTYNGELYNHQVLRADLERRGHRFRGHSDTEVMLELIARDGLLAALAHFDAMFAAALWDRQTQELTLLRDRFGEKPLYYAELDGELVFASELTALMALPRLPRDVDRNAVREFLRFGCVPAPATIFSSCRKLPPASYAVVRNGQLVEIEEYWSAWATSTSIEQRDASVEEHLDHIADIFSKSVRGRMQADVPLGAFLSGGIDSTAVVASMSAQSDVPIKTYTIGFDDNDYDESIFAEQVAHQLGTEHVTTRLQATDALTLVPGIATVYDEPFADSSQLPTLLVSKMTRAAVTVALTGDGGDELFGGYNRHIVLPRIGRIADAWPAALRTRLARLLGWLAKPGRRALIQAMLRLLPAARRPPQFAVKLQKLSDALAAGDLETRYRNAVSLEASPHAWVAGTRDETPSTPAVDGLTPEEWLMLCDTLRYLPDDILVKVDRASMHVSLETRTPFLNHHLYAALAAVPSEMKVRDGVGKWLLRRLVARHVPAALMERPKAGFAVPLDSWLRGPLREWADDLLAPSMVSRIGLLDAEKTSALWQAHRAGQEDQQYRLWSLLMLQAWSEKHLC